MKQILAAILLIPAACRGGTDDAISLAGQWRFALDRANAGLQAQWFAQKLPGQIQLPGSLPAQGIGDDISTNTPWVGGVRQSPWFTAPEYEKYRQPGNVKVPFWLQPDKYYKGAAWYQRDLQIPTAWKDRRVVLELERPHWETRVWLDGRLLGTNDSLSTPHEYALGPCAPGGHTLTIRVDNNTIIDIGDNSHAVSDNTQGDWNGVVGQIELRATPRVWIADVQVYPHAATKSVTVKGTIGNVSGQPGNGRLRFAAGGAARQLDAAWETNGGAFETELQLGAGARTWDEFSPALSELTVSLDAPSPDGFRSSIRVPFGLRDISTDGTQFTLNGRRIFIRGTLECCIFPTTGHPPTDLADWKRVIRIAKAHGLNLLRFHSYCPPEAAFEAGDELGMYFQVETCWANQSTSLGDGKPVDDWVWRETSRILKAYGNHPSFLLMPYGNEPGGKRAAAFLARFVTHFKELDSRRLWTSGSGWPQIPENQFHVTSEPRIQAWGAGLKSRINAAPPATTVDYRDYIRRRSVPVISHEIGQWCVYPNFAEIPKYTGYLKPKNFEIFRDQLAANGMAALARPFLLASGRLQTLCYKEDIESALRTPGMGGFELLDLHDFPGQGTALVGVLDPFWDDKGYVTAEEYSRFCNQTVPLARLAKRVFTTDETLDATLEVANFGPAPLDDARLAWKLVGDRGQVFARGSLPAKTIPVDNNIPAGSLHVDLRNAPAPAKYKLIAGIAGTKFENDWNIWIYPPQPPPGPAGVLVTAKFDDAARTRLKAGGRVLLTIPGKAVANFDQDPVKLGFSSIFWNTAWTSRQAPTTLGILCDTASPALAEFPTEFCSDWQWWYLIHRAGALRLDLLPKGLAPIVRVIDDWVTARPLGLILEGRVGPGKIVVCGFDLTDGALSDPVSRQMRASLADYLGSEKCQPSVELNPAQVASLMQAPGEGKLRGAASIKADSEEEGYGAKNAIDGDPDTMWHTPWAGDVPNFPHELVIQFTAPRALAGFTALPRQDGKHNGWIKDFAFYAGNDGSNWGQPVARGVFSRDEKLKTVKFQAPITAKYVKLVALSGYGGEPWASLAEFNIITPGE